MTTRHPDSALMLDYASGSLAEPVALAVASHACFCADCRAVLKGMDAIGGEMLRAIEPASEGLESLLDLTLSRLDRLEPPEALTPVLDEETRGMLPPPLRPYVAGNLRDLRWRWRGLSMWEAKLAVGVPGYRVSLFRLPPGGSVPPHGHRGREYTVMLEGILCEGDARYGIGDFIAADGNDHHVQHADAKTGCICLTVLDAPVRLTGPVTRLLNPFLTFGR